jgi:hypothetical protein
VCSTGEGAGPWDGAGQWDNGAGSCRWNDEDIVSDYMLGGFEGRKTNQEHVPESEVRA